MNELVLSNNHMPVVCDCNHFITSKGFLHPDRCLDYHVLLYVKSGVFYVTEDDTDYEINAGNIIFLKSNLRHYGKLHIPGGTEWFFVHFYLPQDMDLPVFQPSLQPLPFNTRLESMCALPKMLYDMNETEIASAITSICNYYHSDNPHRAWKLNPMLFDLLSMIANYDSKPAKDSLADSICRYLARHKYEKFSAPALEQEFFLSYKHMAAVFKKEKQMTMQQYHNNLRMQQACSMLTSTLLSISEISNSLGFTDMLYFSRCFHRYSGSSPSEYRLTHYQNL